MKDTWRLLKKIYTFHFIARVRKGCSRFACERVLRPNINFIFWPHCYDRHVVSFLFSWCSGPLHRGFSEGPLGKVWLSLPHLVSRCLEFYWQLHRGFPRSPSVGCGLPYHISSLTLWESAGNCLGTPNSGELNNNSTPTQSPTGSLKSDV